MVSAETAGLNEYRKWSKNIDVNHALGWVYFNQHDFKNARQHRNVALRTGSKDPELLRQVGAIQLALKKANQRNKLIASA